MTETPQVKHHPQNNKFSISIDGRESHLDYTRSGGGPMVITHTYVNQADRGGGVAGTLTKEALRYAKENDLRVVPQCGYVRSYIQKHPEHQPLLADEGSTGRSGDQGGSEEGSHHQHDAHPPPRGWLATYKPLLLIVAYTLGGTAIVGAVRGDWSSMPLMAVFMGLFFVAFSFFKMLDIAGFAEAYSSYDLIAARSRVYGLAYPFLELGLGVWYLLGLWPIAVNAVTLVVMLLGLAGVVNAVASGRDIQCGCLGTVFDLPMSTVTIVEDAAMAAMAGGMLLWLLL